MSGNGKNIEKALKSLKVFWSNMNHNLRIIPRLDIKNNTIVKGIHMEGLRVVGVPADASKKYYEQGADELLYLDVVASLYERNSLIEIIRDIADHIFVPLTVGGGIRTIENIREILRAGADKVAINTAAIKRPEFIREASKKFGSQCIIGSIEVKRMGEDKWEAYVDTGREATGVDAFEWAQKLVDLGAGELLVTSIDHEGTQRGMGIELIKKIARHVSVPVIACGGCGNPDHLVELIQQTNVSAVACASIFHYDKLTITAVKEYLRDNEINVSLRSRE